MNNTNYLFSLKVENTELTIGGDKDFVEEYLKKWLPVFNGKVEEQMLSSFSGVEIEKKEESGAVRPSKMSMTDFIKLKEPKNLNDFSLVVFFYMERYEGMENTGVPAEKVTSVLSKLPNGPDIMKAQEIFNTLSSQGFINMLEGSDLNPRFQVSFTGEQCIKQGFE